MEEFLGVFVEPWELDNNTRHDKIHDGLYGFDEKCVVSDDVDRYGAGNFDLVSYDDFPSYWQSTSAGRMLIAGDFESTVDFISEIDVSSDELVFENYTVRGFADSPDARDVLFDELRSMLPFQQRNNLVDENTAYEALQEMGVPDADVVYLNNVAKPVEGSMYYSDDSA